MAGVVLVYGGTGGIGSATAERLVRRGHAVHLVARDEGRLTERAAALRASFTAGDVLDPALFPRATEAARATGPLAGLVYAVGTITLKPLAQVSAEMAERDYRINALGALHAVQAALPGFKAAEGVPGVVLFSTVAVAQGFASHVSIAMAKGAVEALARSLAAELAPKVRVNAVAPSLTRTPLAAPLTRNDAVANGIAGMHALQRLGEAEDVAALAAFLVSEEAAYVTGQVIGVDGGRSTLRTKG
jgi:NAD(P)-dependent dehydrogenase (short-subunit alcohol dehydrogenase family)